MKDKLVRYFSAFCVATILTQAILFVLLTIRGTINGDSITRIIALVNGIDISGDRLQEVFSRQQDMEQPDFDEILEARREGSLDSELRERSLQVMKDEVVKMQAELAAEQSRFDERRVAFETRLEEIRKGAQEEGVKQVQRSLQTLDPAQAKNLLLRIYEDERIDDVVNIIQAMPSEKQKDIMGEFVTADELDKLHEINRRRLDGTPTTTLIDQAK
jgi:hypothetical protein